MTNKLTINDSEINITTLKFPENVRRRPGKLIGSTDNPNVLLREIIDNSVDEAFGSTQCTKIYVDSKSGRSGGWYVIADNGRGIPILWDKEYNKTKTEMAMATVDSGSKFSKDLETIAVGMNGCGAAAVNALSSDFIILSKITKENYDKSTPAVKSSYLGADTQSRQEQFYCLQFKKGIKVSEGVIHRDSFGDFYFPEGMSTVTAFRPDETIFDEITASYSKKNLAYVQVVLSKFYDKEITVEIDGVKSGNEFKPYEYEFLKRIEVQAYDGSTKAAAFYVNFEVDTNLSNIEETGSVNSLVVNRGVHINYIRNSFVEALRNQYNISHSHLQNGLKLNVICVAGEVDFNSQTKERCVKIDGLYQSEVLPLIQPEFRNIFNRYKDYWGAHVTRLEEYADSLTKISAIQKIKSIIGTVEGGNRVQSKIPASVRDASNNDRLKCELFISEGKSASGPMLKSRNPSIHAILELRGVPMNAINADLESFMDNEEMASIAIAVGVGAFEYFNLEMCRYGKIIIAADADSDGYRIAALVAGMFCKKMAPLVADGRLYIAESPIYIQDERFIYQSDDIEKVLDRTRSFSRIKGLGELDPNDVEQIFFDNNKRRLHQITLGNVDQALLQLTTSYHRKELMVEKGIITDEYNLGIL